MESTNNIYYVYCISNNLDGKMYIGYTKRFERRMKEHCKSEQVIGRAIRKHGVENFTYTKIARYVDEQEAKDVETFIISELKTYIPKIGYNETLGGEGCSGWWKLVTPEQILEIINKRLKTLSKKSVKEKEMYSKNLSDAAIKAHAKKSDKEKALWRKNISEGHTKRSPGEKALTKQRKQKTNDKKSPDEKALTAKIKSISLRGKKRTDEQKKRYSDAQKIKLSKEEIDFIIQKRNEGLSFVKTSKSFFEVFNKKIGKTLIYRVLKENQI